MTMLDVLGQVKLPELDCLAFASIAGSHAYGTQRAGSDLDVRGVFLGDPRNLLTRRMDEPMVVEGQDMTFWPLHKYLGFLIDGRPTALELLFTREQDRFAFNRYGRMVLENREMFLSKRAISSYQGYIDRTYGDLMRMLSRDCGCEEEHQKLRLEMLAGAADSLDRRFSGGDCRVFLEDGALVCDLSLQKYPLGKLQEDLTAIQSMLRSYDAAVKKQTKVDRTEKSINKTACHCVRLMAELTELASTGTFSTYRGEKREYKLLCGILNGQYQLEDGSFDREPFMELVDLMREDMRYAIAHTCLPDEVDTDKVRALELDLMSEYVRNYLA